MLKISVYSESVIKQAALALKMGNLVVFPTETVYGLGADAMNPDAVSKVYKVKGRPKDHPLIVHISSIDNLEVWATNIPKYALVLANSFWPGPMTLVLPRTNVAKNYITGNQNTVAVRIPSNTIALELLIEFEKFGGIGVVAPSANMFGRVSPTTAQAAFQELNAKLSYQDVVIEGNQSEIGIESTIIDCTQDEPLILRPGKIDAEMISRLIPYNSRKRDGTTPKVLVPGLHKSHYAPNAQIILAGEPSNGDGFIALSEIPTPDGAIRLASPKDHDEFAYTLYSSFRLADIKGIKKIFIKIDVNSGISIALLDRLTKASNSKNIN